MMGGLVVKWQNFEPIGHGLDVCQVAFHLLRMFRTEHQFT
jgi:hypothetical protein